RRQQGVDRGIPRLVRGDVGELVRAGHITADVDVGEVGAQQRIGLDGAARGQAHAELLQPESFDIGAAAKRQQQRVELQLDLRTIVPAYQPSAAASRLDPQCLVTGSDVHAVGAQLAGYLRG